MSNSQNIKKIISNGILAIGIDKLMKVVTGITLEHDPVYLRKRNYHLKDGIDDLIGFNPNCIK